MILDAARAAELWRRREGERHPAAAATDEPEVGRDDDD
jgi:hypothetical protein